LVSSVIQSWWSGDQDKEVLQKTAYKVQYLTQLLLARQLSERAGTGH
jgi:hypothetical protein